MKKKSFLAHNTTIKYKLERISIDTNPCKRCVVSNYLIWEQNNGGADMRLRKCSSEKVL